MNGSVGDSVEDVPLVVGNQADAEMPLLDEGPSDNSYHSSQEGDSGNEDARAAGVNLFNQVPRQQLVEE